MIFLQLRGAAKCSCCGLFALQAPLLLLLQQQMQQQQQVQQQQQQQQLFQGKLLLPSS